MWRSGTEDPIQNCEKNPPGVELRYLGKKTTAGGRTRVTGKKGPAGVRTRVTGKKGTRRGLNPGHWVHSGYTLGTRWVRGGYARVISKWAIRSTNETLKPSKMESASRETPIASILGGDHTSRWSAGQWVRGGYGVGTAGRPDTYSGAT